MGFFAKKGIDKIALLLYNKIRKKARISLLFKGEFYG